MVLFKSNDYGQIYRLLQLVVFVDTQILIIFHNVHLSADDVDWAWGSPLHPKIHH